MEINRRKLRQKLGTRKNRREGTKTKAIRGTGGGATQRVQKYRNFKRSRAATRPSVLLERLIQKAYRAGEL